MMSAAHSTKASIAACQRYHTPLESQLVLPYCGQQLLNVSTFFRDVSRWTIPYGPWRGKWPFDDEKPTSNAWNLRKLGCWPQGWQHHGQDHLSQPTGYYSLGDLQEGNLLKLGVCSLEGLAVSIWINPRTNMCQQNVWNLQTCKLSVYMYIIYNLRRGERKPASHRPLFSIHTLSSPQTFHPQTLHPQSFAHILLTHTCLHTNRSSIYFSSTDLSPIYFHPYTFRPQTLHPQTFQPQTLHPWTFHPLTFHPLSFHPETLHPQTFHPQTFHMFHPQVFSLPRWRSKTGNAQILTRIVNPIVAIRLLWRHSWLCFPLVGLPMRPRFPKLHSGRSPTDAIPRWTSQATPPASDALHCTSKNKAKRLKIPRLNPKKQPWRGPGRNRYPNVTFLPSGTCPGKKCKSDTLITT